MSTDDRSGGGPENRFESVIEHAGLEPVFGPKQTEFLEATLYRLANGPPMTPEDLRVYVGTGCMLGLINQDEASELLGK